MYVFLFVLLSLLCLGAGSCVVQSAKHCDYRESIPANVQPLARDFRSRWNAWRQKFVAGLTRRYIKASLL